MRRLFFLISMIFVALILLFTLNPLPKPSVLAEAQIPSVKIFDRNGTLLRETIVASNHRQPVTLQEVSPRFLDLLLTTEDARFWWHPGIDPLALIRALISDLRAGKIVSGASTITMQLARRDLPNGRSWQKKIKEMLRAIRLEVSASKKDILTAYVNGLPFANGLSGIAAASETYFRKKPSDLSLSESAYLLAVIRAPSRRNPYRVGSELLAERDKILDRYAELKPKWQLDVLSAKREQIVLTPLTRNFLAPHFTDYVLEHEADTATRTSIRTSFNLELQKVAAHLMRQQITALADKHVTQAAVIVLDNQDAQILAYVGSEDFWDTASSGMIDGVRQLRQPGSSLKPFAYATALDKDFAPSTILADVPRSYESEIGSYAPENYDKTYHGPVSLRTALANSLNVPAVDLLQRIGVPVFYHRLKELGFKNLDQAPEYYGLGLVLGDGEVSLLQQAQAYSVFARDGIFCKATYDFDKTNRAECRDKKNRIFSDRSVAIIRDFLSDKTARRLVFGADGPLDFDSPVMVKTGTSQGHRDNWTIAVTPKNTVAVWVGNFDGTPMDGVSGVTGAAPIAHEIVDWLLAQSGQVVWQAPKKLKKQPVCALSGLLPGKNCPELRLEFVPESSKLKSCDVHRSYHIDSRNGLLASSDCAFAKDQVFLNLPSVFAAWQREKWPKTLAPQSVSPQCPFYIKKAAQQNHSPHILKPERGVVYKRDLHRPPNVQAIPLLASNQDERLAWEWSNKTLPITTKSLPLQEGKQSLSLVCERECAEFSNKAPRADGKVVLDEVDFVVR